MRSSEVSIRERGKAERRVRVVETARSILADGGVDAQPHRGGAAVRQLFGVRPVEEMPDRAGEVLVELAPREVRPRHAIEAAAAEVDVDDGAALPDRAGHRHVLVSQHPCERRDLRYHVREIALVEVRLGHAARCRCGAVGSAQRRNADDGATMFR